MTNQITWKSILTTLVHGDHLDAEQSWWYVDDLMKGQADSVAVGAVLAMQQQLGLTSEEVSGAAKAMVEHAIPLPVPGEITDIVGTGGDGASTVNLSTMGSVIAAAAGITIVKHGNRAASSKCGAADCLEALGLPLDLTPEQVREVGERVGITFAFAKTFHPAMRFVGPVRSALGIPCVFNVLGPLTNPAHPQHVAIGCANRALSPLMADVCAAQGQSGMVYTSQEGLDELAPTGPVSVWEIRNGKVQEFEFDPVRDLQLERVTVEQLRGGDAAYNAQAVRDLFAGNDVPFRSTALLNAASAIVADGRCIEGNDAVSEYTTADGEISGDTTTDNTIARKYFVERFRTAYQIAQETVDTGKAAALLDRWITTAQSMA